MIDSERGPTAEPEGALSVEQRFDQLYDSTGSALLASTRSSCRGQPARLAHTDDGDGGPGGWVLQGTLPDGSAVVVEAPGELTGEQVVQIADQITYTP